MIYSDTFFDHIEEGCLSSAEVVVPMLLSIFRPTTVVDVGCGRGIWLKVLRDHGVHSVVGIDGHYVDRSRLLIPEECFVACDLSKEIQIKGRYDLAVCLEVAEHLPRRVAATLIRALTAAAPVVLFSAAIPGQGGTHHVNEQWPCYWNALFEENGYVGLDPFRPQLLANDRVEFWYRQNMVFYASKDAMRNLPPLRRIGNGLGIEWLHATIAGQNMTVRGLCRMFPRAIKNAVARRFAWGSGQATNFRRSGF